MPYGDSIDHNNQINTSSSYVQGASTYQPGYTCGYTCGNCGQYVYGSHACYYYAQPVQTVIYSTAGAVPMPDPTQQAILDELRRMREAFEALIDPADNLRKALETLGDLTVNDHEEVRRCDDGGSEDPAVDPARGIEGCTFRDATEVTKRLGF